MRPKTFDYTDENGKIVDLPDKTKKAGLKRKILSLPFFGTCENWKNIRKFEIMVDFIKIAANILLKYQRL